jgi:5-methylcytosine-specific restriction protein B
LLYLAFPSHFLPIINVGHKKAIRQAFAHLLADSAGDDLDGDLFQIMLRLQSAHGGPVDPYLPPFVDEWRTTTRPTEERRAWLVRPWHGETGQVRSWRKDGYVSVSGAHLAGLAPGAGRAEVRAAIEAGYQHLDYIQRMVLTSEYHAFWSVMGVDDLVATVVDDQLSAGVVTGQPSYEAGERPQLRWAVEWLDTAPVPVGQLAVPLPAELERPGTIVDITGALDVLAQLVEVTTDDTSPGVDEPHPALYDSGTPAVLPLAAVTSELVELLHLDNDWLQELVDLLRVRRQVVLYGPPGTGKTHLAQAIAHHIAARDAVQLVQFHPSY